MSVCWIIVLVCQIWSITPKHPCVCSSHTSSVSVLISLSSLYCFRAQMKQSELYPWIRTIMWNAIVVRYVPPPELSLIQKLGLNVCWCGCEAGAS